MSESRSGGCLCGAVRFEVAGEPLGVALCHCSMCRRAAGAPAVAWAMVQADAFTIQEGEPVRYASSSEATRSFCGRCGTQIGFEASFLPGLVDITVASFDAPETLPPQMHIWNSSRLPWLDTADSWPRHEAEPPHG